MYIPFMYKDLNVYAGLYSPATQKNRNNKSFDYWMRQLYFRLKGNLEFDFADVWQGEVKDYIIAVILLHGYVGVAHDEELGLFAQYCNAYGFNFYYQPTKFTVANPYWKESKTYDIGKNGLLIRALPDYAGFYDILSYYAEKLSLLDNSLNMALVNSKIPHILGGKNKSSVMALKQIMDKINKGESSVFYDRRISDTESGEPFQFIELFGKDKYIIDLLLADRQTIINDFDTEIGIKSLPYNKKERLIANEVDIKGNEASTKLNVVISTINDDLKKVNDMYHVDFSVKPLRRGDDNE